MSKFNDYIPRYSEWLPGDLIRRIYDSSTLIIGNIYEIKHYRYPGFISIDGYNSSFDPRYFEFVKRPQKGNL